MDATYRTQFGSSFPYQCGPLRCCCSYSLTSRQSRRKLHHGWSEDSPDQDGIAHLPRHTDDKQGVCVYYADHRCIEPGFVRPADPLANHIARLKSSTSDKDAGVCILAYLPWPSHNLNVVSAQPLDHTHDLAEANQRQDSDAPLETDPRPM